MPLPASHQCPHLVVARTSARYTSPLRPLRLYLLILILGAILPGALLTGVLVWRALAGNRAVSERRLIESARVDASALDREFAATISTLQVLGTSSALEPDDLEAFQEEARRVQSTQPGWYSIVLLSADGRPLVNTRQALGAPLARSPTPRACSGSSRRGARSSAPSGPRRRTPSSRCSRSACR